MYLTSNFFRISVAFGKGGLGFNSRAIQIGHSVAYGSPPLHRFSSVVRSCVGQAFSRGDEPRHSLHPLKTYLRFLMTLQRRYKWSWRLNVLATNCLATKRPRLKVVIRYW